MLFPVRLVVAIREPTVARGPLRNHIHPFIMVDSPTDVAFPHPNSDLLTSTHWATDLNADELPDPPPLIETYRSLGNQHFKTSRLLPAAFAYTRGLDLDGTAHFLRLNRAECYLRLGYFSAALADVEHVLTLPDLLPAARIKALYRAGKAHYGRRDYPSAVERFKEFSLLSPGNAEATAGMSRASARLRESASGRYEWTRLFKESQQHPRIDVADFVGPVRVEAIPNRGGGRGIVATKPIHLGDILVCAFVHMSRIEKMIVFRRLLPNLSPPFIPTIYHRTRSCAPSISERTSSTLNVRLRWYRV
jgi:tetratricopeptide (TPR) repeat protein